MEQALANLFCAKKSEEEKARMIHLFLEKISLNYKLIDLRGNDQRLCGALEVSHFEENRISDFLYNYCKLNNETLQVNSSRKCPKRNQLVER